MDQDDDSYKDYYKNYKRNLRSANKTKRRGVYFKIVVVFVLVGGILSYITFFTPRQESNNEIQDTGTAEDAPVVENNNKKVKDTGDKTTKQVEEKKTSKNTQSGTSNGATNAPSQSTKQDNNDDDKERQKLLAEIKKNEEEKQRLAKEQEALQLEKECNSIKNNMTTELRNTQASYNSTIQNISCPAFGGCPARSAAKASYERSVNAIKSSYKAKWEDTGCDGSLY